MSEVPLFAFLWVAVAGVAALAMSSHLKRFRTDIPEDQAFTSGRSIFWMFNVYNPDNYTADGRRKLAWLYVITVLGFAGGVFLLLSA